MNIGRMNRLCSLWSWDAQDLKQVRLGKLWCGFKIDDGVVYAQTGLRRDSLVGWCHADSRVKSGHYLRCAERLFRVAHVKPSERDLTYTLSLTELVGSAAVYRPLGGDEHPVRVWYERLRSPRGEVAVFTTISYRLEMPWFELVRTPHQGDRVSFHGLELTVETLQDGVDDAVVAVVEAG